MAQITLNSTGVASDGSLVLQSNGTTTAVTISTAQVATLAKDAVVNGLTVGRGAGAVATNTAIGASALASNTTGSLNTAVGYQAGYTNTTGIANAFFGYQAGYGNTTGQANTFVGYQSGNGVTTGSNNTIIGRYSGSAAPISATGSNYIVLSDGDGNVRAYWNGSIAIFNGTISPVQATTAAAPAYVKGAMYFDTTLNKLRIGGATAWETVTSV